MLEPVRKFQSQHSKKRTRDSKKSTRAGKISTRAGKKIIGAININAGASKEVPEPVQ